MIETPRLILRDWREEDLEPFAAMCADPVVMETLGPLKSREETAVLIEWVVARAQENGFTFWVVERKEDSRFLGWCGLTPGTVPKIEGRIEIGWRLASDCWGKGYAREGAEASLAWGFAELECDSIWAITSRGNSRSWGLMIRLGMQRRPDLDFGHPAFAPGHPLHQHIVYAIDRPA